jgi:hypothetical protein
MSGYEFYGNSITNATTGVLINGGRRNTIYGNSFVDCDLDIYFIAANIGEKAICTPPHGSMFLKLQKLNYTQPPYSTRYPELLTIAGDHPCLPVHNNITSNIYCHSHSMNVSVAGRGFINQSPETITKAWYSTLADNREVCAMLAV